MGIILNYSMKKLFILIFILFTSTSFLFSQDIEKMNKKELREFAKNQIQLIDDKNNLINNQNIIIDNSYNEINELNLIKKNLEEKISNLKGRISNLENYILLASDTILELKKKNNTIPELNKKLAVLTDSIININQLLSIYMPSSNSVSTYSFLNNLYLGYDNIQNQTFQLTPAGILTTQSYEEIENTYYKSEFHQFYRSSEISWGVQVPTYKRLTELEDLKNFQETIKTNYVIESNPNKYFPIFSFVKGKLLTINTEGDEGDDYLFSVKYIDENGEKNNLSGQKGMYFSLTDENEREYLIKTIVIDNEVYLMMGTDEMERLNFFLSFSKKYMSKITRVENNGNGYESEVSIGGNINNIFEYEYNSRTRQYEYWPDNDSHYYLVCEGYYFSVFTKQTLYSTGQSVIPKYVLFKFERLSD